MLADSDAAVYSLLESLLQEVDEPAATRTEPAARIETQVKTETLLKKPAAEPISKVIEAPVSAELSTPVVTDKMPAETQGSLPDWVSDNFSCLLFDVEGTELAIPLASLNSIAVWDSEALPMPAQPDWHLGVLAHRDNNVIVLDTARLIMPEKIQQTAEERRVQHGSHFLVVNQRWALSCNGIKQTIQLKPEQVRWRPQRTNRMWAVGTLIERLCVLLDADTLIKEISE